MNDTRAVDAPRTGERLRPSAAAAPPAAAPRIGAGRRAAALGLILVMAAGSIAMWLAAPVGWLWLASQMTSSTAPSAGPYLLVLLGLAVTFVVLGKLLGAADRAYKRVTGADERRRQAKWMRSMRGERDAPEPVKGVLEVVMITSVSLALAAFGIWFFFFAGSSLPGT